MYGLVKAIIEHNDEFADVHPSGKQYNLENAAKSLIIPIHPGAEKYYKEKGVLE